MREVQKLAGDYKAFFSKEGAGPQSEYTIQHPGLYFLIGPEGRVRYTYTENHRNADLIVKDLNKLKTILAKNQPEWTS
jgi:cytochrome oxidase Cu insertion factor (SCO1/SenC/PrrC family)